jgi:hypothetical protein
MLDGVVEAPDQWHFPYFNDEMGAAVDATIAEADTLLLGRLTRQLRRGGPDRRTRAMRMPTSPSSSATPYKVVVSNQGLDFTWRNSERFEGDFVEAVTALKNEPGGDIAHERLGVDPSTTATGHSSPSLLTRNLR